MDINAFRNHDLTQYQHIGTGALRPSDKIAMANDSISLRTWAWRHSSENGLGI